jgi:hypothetical protein
MNIGRENGALSATFRRTRIHDGYKLMYPDGTLARILNALERSEAWEVRANRFQSTKLHHMALHNGLCAFVWSRPIWYALLSALFTTLAEAKIRVGRRRQNNNEKAILCKL